MPCLLVLTLLCSMSLTAPAEERATSWYLTDLYADDAAVEKDIAEVQALIDALPSLRGTQNIVEGVIACYEFIDTLSIKLNRLDNYAALRLDLNSGDNEAMALYDRIGNMWYDADEKSAFFNEELFGQSEDFLDELAKDERMAPYLLEFTRTRKERAHLLTDAQEMLLSPLYSLTSGASDLYNMLTDWELPFQEIEFPDGITRPADENNYVLVMAGDFTQEFRKEFTAAMIGSYNAFRNTYAQNYQNYCIGVSESAKAHGYASAPEADLASVYVETALYQSVIDASLEGNEIIGRYAALMMKELGLDEIYSFDINLCIAPDPGIQYTYDEACEIVLAALAPLGEDYVADARKALAGGWVDVYPAEGKRASAYTVTTRGAHPYMLLNFDGTYDSMSTLAHELGHAMNYWYSDKTQTVNYSAYPGAIVGDVTSMLNEFLLSDYMIKNAQTDAERKYYIAQEMNRMYYYFFVIAEYARFQQISMEALESGEALTADLLEQLWMENREKYSGGVLKTPENGGVSWARIQQFLGKFYLYQFATALSASCNIAQRITAGEEGAAESYLAFISAGDPASTAETLAIAGVDTTDNDFITGLFDRFAALMDEYESME